VRVAAARQAAVRESAERDGVKRRCCLYAMRYAAMLRAPPPRCHARCRDARCSAAEAVITEVRPAARQAPMMPRCRFSALTKRDARARR